MTRTCAKNHIKPSIFNHPPIARTLLLTVAPHFVLRESSQELQRCRLCQALRRLRGRQGLGRPRGEEDGGGHRPGAARGEQGRVGWDGIESLWDGTNMDQLVVWFSCTSTGRFDGFGTVLVACHFGDLLAIRLPQQKAGVSTPTKKRCQCTNTFTQILSLLHTTPPQSTSIPSPS